MEALYITGHSLGGAMAALMTIMLLTEENGYDDIRPRWKATYTFGQPMMGSPDFAAACNRNHFLRNNVIRYIYNRDVAPQLPPTFTGDFAHFGQEYRYTGTEPEGEWAHQAMPMRQLGRVGRLLLSPLPIVTRQITAFRRLRFRASFQDHFPRHYVAALAPSDCCTEFGP
jgi:hypothetical protein